MPVTQKREKENIFGYTFFSFKTSGMKAIIFFKHTIKLKTFLHSFINTLILHIRIRAFLLSSRKHILFKVQRRLSVTRESVKNERRTMLHLNYVSV